MLHENNLIEMSLRLNRSEPLFRTRRELLSIGKRPRTRDDIRQQRTIYSILTFLINSLSDDRGQIQFFSQNLIANLFEKGISPCTAEFPEVKVKRKIIDHYLKGYVI